MRISINQNICNPNHLQSMWSLKFVFLFCYLEDKTDKKCEAIILERIQSVYPDHIFIAEESADGSNVYNMTDAPTWYIDPVDGTTNFVHGFPFCCVSIAFALNNESVVAVVYNPNLDEMFTAIKGKGAFLNNSAIKVSETVSLQSAVIGTEFGYDRTKQGVHQMVTAITSLLTSGLQGMRSMGSAALNMCYVAAGRFDLYYEGKDKKIGPKPWDMAAGRLIVAEAGGLSVDPFMGKTLDITSGRVLAAANETLLAEYLRVVPHYMALLE